ncbi:MAG: hypothetical protein ACI9F9_001639, partial [Candidatus Paceibacteria bacterium]
MAKVCGLRIGPRRFEIVVLDGSPKKPKIITTLAGEIPPDELDPIGAAAHAIKSTLRAYKIPTDSVRVVIESRSAAFRTVTLPITDISKVESVLKFEVESQLPQFNIDDVVVDFQIKETTANSSSLLVTAVPKSEVRSALELCEKAGFEPLEVELETTALVNSAIAANLCGIEEAYVLVHVGEESTAVCIIDGGKLREMRVIQTGALAYTPHGEVPAESEGEEGEEELPSIERGDEIVSRIRRELARTVSGARTVNELLGVHVCGFLLPGMIGEDILGVPVKELEACEIDEYEGEVHEEYDTAAIAYGAALGQMGGGVVNASLRREELRFSGALERIELPLAVMFLLITTFLGVRFMFLEKEYKAIQNNLTFILDSSVNYMIPDPKSGRPGSLEFPSERIVNYVKSTTGKVPGSDPVEIRVDPLRDRYGQLMQIKTLLNSEQRELQKTLGNDTDLVLPQSALKGLTMVLDHLAQSGGKYGRVSFRMVAANFHSSPRDGDSVTVTLEMCFFADSSTVATQNYEQWFADLEKEP